MAGQFEPTEPREVVGRMTLEEKLDLVSGNGLWRTAVNYRLNIPETIMTDGTHGVRYSEDQIDRPQAKQDGFRQFLELISRRGAGSDASDGYGSTKAATCFPTGSCVANSWDTGLIYQLGAHLAVECQAMGVNLLLGPGINIRRTPLAGRGYEYYSEDPVVSGDLAAAFVAGLQDGGVGACLKHFACNNSEIERTTMSSDVSERALREVYLAGFERAISQARPWAVMSSYNPLNGVQAAENDWLLTRVLRDEWNFSGLVISDWYAIKDRPASMRAGNDLDMPESPARKAALKASVVRGDVPETQVDRACIRVLDFVQKAKAGERKAVTVDEDTHHVFARTLAAESLVLLKNREGTLPLRPDRDRAILVVGPGAVRPVIQGSGSATVRPTKVDRPLDELTGLLGRNQSLVHCAGIARSPHEQDAATAEAVGLAQKSDTVIVFAATDIFSDGETADRPHLRLAPGYDGLIEALAKSPARVVVVLACPDAVEMPWNDAVDAILCGFFPGQGGGHAIASVLTGHTNPSGKLTVSFPKREQDIPGYHTYPGENGRHAYAEDIYVGYRMYDLRETDVLYPFGHGLGYCGFTYGAPRLLLGNGGRDGDVTVCFKLTNDGTRAGKEVVQLYIRAVNPGLKRPVRELKAFRKVGLEPGETREVCLSLTRRDFQYYDPGERSWVMRADAFEIELGASSRDLRQSVSLECIPDAMKHPEVARETPPGVLLKIPGAVDLVLDLFVRKLGATPSEARDLLNLCRMSFLGIADTFNWFFADAFSDADIQQLVDGINAEAAARTDHGIGRLTARDTADL